jgi:hypothetical protein
LEVGTHRERESSLGPTVLHFAQAIDEYFQVLSGNHDEYRLQWIFAARLPTRSNLVQKCFARKENGLYDVRGGNVAIRIAQIGWL